MRSGGCGVLLCLVVVALIVLVSRLKMVMRSCGVMSGRRDMSFSGRMVRGRRHDWDPF
jgi:hypothetical protein